MRFLKYKLLRHFDKFDVETSIPGAGAKVVGAAVVGGGGAVVGAAVIGAILVGGDGAVIGATVAGVAVFGAAVVGAAVVGEGVAVVGATVVDGNAVPKTNGMKNLSNKY